MKIRKVSHGFGAIVGDFDIADVGDKKLRQKIHSIFLAYHVVCFRGAFASPPEFVAFSRAFGVPKVQLLADYHLDGYPEISLISNYNKIGGSVPHVRATYWHTDDSYLPQPAKATLLCGQELPASGGSTEFINCHAVLHEMSPAMRLQIDERRAVHKYLSRRNKAIVAGLSPEEKAKTPDVLHPLVRTHPETGQLSLYINPNRIDHIEGISMKESNKLLDDIYAFAFQEKFRLQHNWKRGDILMWDNRCTMHRAKKDFVITERREFLRILLKGDTPI